MREVIKKRGEWMEEEQVKKESFFQKIQKSKKKQVLFFVVSMVMLLLMFLPLRGRWDWQATEKKVKAIPIVSDYYNIFCSIENVCEEEKNIIFRGWGLKLNSLNKEIYISLVDSESNEMVLKTEMQNRDDVTANVFGNYELGKIGFSAVIPAENINDNVVYKIYFSLICEENLESESSERQHKIFTGKFFYNGKISSANPDEFYRPLVISDLMKNVVEQGKLLLYEKQMNLWIYSYEKNLYWIVGNDFPFNENGKSTYIPYQLRTINVRDLPEKRQKSGFDNQDFYFENNELFLEENYRIAKAEIPDKYPILNITTGLYDQIEEVWLYKVVISMSDELLGYKE